MARKDINFNTFVKRDLSKTTVDWGSVASNLTTDLLKVRKDREGQRAEIQKNTDEAASTLNEMEDYSNQTLQGLALGMSGDSANFLRVQNDLFKRGLITQTEFAQNKQRVLGDWKQFGNISKRWENDYLKMVERADNGDASQFEIWFNEQNSEFGNLNEVKGMVNPDTGNLSLVRPDENGYISKDPSRHVSIHTLQNRFNTQINNLTKDGGLDKTLNASVDDLGELILAEILVDKEGNRTEGVLTVEGQKQALNSKGIQEYLNGTVNSILTNDYKTFSVLGDLVGGYKPTLLRSEAEADPLRVLVEYSKETGLPKPITDAPNWEKQQEVAREALKNRMISMLDNKQAIKPGETLSPYQAEMLKMRREAAAKGIEDTNSAIDEEYNMIKYKPIIKGRDASKNQLMGGKKATSYLKQELGEDINSWSGNDDDAQVEKVFNNIIQAVMDKNIFTDLETGMYGETQKPFNLSFSDSGADRVTIEMGSETVTYPPLASELKAIAPSTIRETTAENFTVYDEETGEYVAYTLDNMGERGIMPGYYGVDSNGDGKIDKYSPGVENYDKDSDGLNSKLYDKTSEMYDYILRNVITPVDAELRDLQEKNYYSKKKNQKKQTPISKK
tara:strand:+ start:888 stop:2738 length:1851 start_codon:yes stop_codon:yes gene_type:complete